MNYFYEDIISEITISGQNSTTVLFSSIPSHKVPKISATPVGENANFNCFVESTLISSGKWSVKISSSAGDIPIGTKFHIRAFANC